ncbi:serine/threonine-protein phosphatase [Actinospica sp. MGRD01-02]|uniref:Serine/threonine-protein phosphatase n=1 Tax=Actinospica acidithermotolerans TaxID=2828514 RepID=A0A941EBQ3_9ACTN|nr:protein phosphatase 2C domain-containing protein [Actinospica acidithermotolerans]MBR7828546.1 serine/threonine-protein phosphatase [Actinospica acidithermotolerans]
MAALEVSAGAASDPGPVRAVNEDRVFAGRRVFVVADGMGGHAAGEVASAIVTDRLAELDMSEDLRLDDIRTGLFDSNQDILVSAQRNPAQAGMGATVAGLAMAWYGGSRHWVVFNAGDCRVYRYAHGALTQLTVDHTEAAELVAAGLLDAAAAPTHPSRHVVTRSLGSDPAPEPDVCMLPPTPGETFVLCSDGLFGEVDDAEIEEVLSAEPTPSGAAASLVSLAVRRGGRDNVSVVVVVHADEEEPSAGGADERTVPRPPSEEER